MQAFKETDEIELRVSGIFTPKLNEISQDLTQFFNEAYVSYMLGDVLFDLDRSPLADSITKDVFRSSYFAIHQLNTRPGTFEFYLDVFKAVFGEDVVVEFSIPGPGKLQINIEAITIVENYLMARRIENGGYVYYNLVTQDGDFIMAQVADGPKTQSEVDAIMIELVPQGIWVNTTLVIS